MPQVNLAHSIIKYCRFCLVKLVIESNCRASYIKNYNYVCNSCDKARNQDYDTNLQFRQRQRVSLLRQYSLTLEQYDIMLLEQHGLCAICKRLPGGRFKHLAVDHDHKTGLIRKLLCNKCNAMLGLANDSIELLETALTYLKENQLNMAWTDITLVDVKLEEKSFAQIPVGDYTFTLQPGAKVRVNNFGTEEIVAAAAIADGDQAGRWVFLQYPDPNSTNKDGKKQQWSAQALKKLEMALGTDALPGEGSVDYLNRVAGNGHSRFKGTIAPANKIRTGETEPRNEFKLFSVAPAA